MKTKIRLLRINLRMSHTIPSFNDFEETTLWKYWEKVKNAGNQHFLLLRHRFLPFKRQILYFICLISEMLWVKKCNLSRVGYFPITVNSLFFPCWKFGTTFLFYCICKQNSQRKYIIYCISLCLIWEIISQYKPQGNVIKSISYHSYHILFDVCRLYIQIWRGLNLCLLV